MRRLLVLDVSVRVLFPSIMTLSLFFLFSGHNHPGGGFVGGLAGAAALSLRYVAGGVAAVRNSIRLSPSAILGLGLIAAVGTAIVPMLLGGAVLEHGAASFHLPVVGEVHVSSALSFDTGVYLIVLGLALMIFEAFGDETEAELDRIEAPTAPAANPIDEYLPADQLASVGDDGERVQR